MLSLCSQSSWLRRAVWALVALALLLAPIHSHDNATDDSSSVAVATLDMSGPAPGAPPDGDERTSNPCSVCVLIKQVASIDGFGLPELMFGSVVLSPRLTEAIPSSPITDLFRPPIASAA